MLGGRCGKDDGVGRLLVEGGEVPVAQADRLFDQVVLGVAAGEGVALFVGQQRAPAAVDGLAHRPPAGQGAVKGLHEFARRDHQHRIVHGQHAAHPGAD